MQMQTPLSVRPLQGPSQLEELRTAIAEGHLDAVRSIFSRWTGSTRPTLDNLAPLLATAVANDQPSLVTFLLDEGVPMNPLLFLQATESGLYEILQTFLDHGWEINTPINRLSPPALVYTFHDQTLLNWFLDNGADPNARCDRDCTALSWAVRSAPFAIIKTLFDRNGDAQCGQLLHYAAERELADRVDVFTFLLEKGLSKSLNLIMYQNRTEDYLMNMHTGIGTPLHHAAGKGFLDLVRLLVARGADPLIKDPRGKLPVDRALFNHHTEVVDFLRSLTTAPSEPHSDFVDTPGYHYTPVSLDDFVKPGQWKAVHPT